MSAGLVPDGLSAPQSSWWAKYRHAEVHLRSLRLACEEYAAGNPVEARGEPTGKPGQIEYRFHQREEVPVGISLILGDVLHNLRSALDSLVLGLVSEDIGRDMTAEEEWACQFPICSNPRRFEKFFAGTVTRPQPIRNSLISDRVRRSLRAAQPFAWMEEAHKAGVQTQSWKEVARFDPLTTISKLSNIDKHRRVTVATWWPKLAFYSGDEGSDYHWKPVAWPPFEDGQVIVKMTGTGPEPAQVVHQFALVLPESPSHQPEEYFAQDHLPEEPENWYLKVGFAIQAAIDEYRRLGQQDAEQTGRSTP